MFINSFITTPSDMAARRIAVTLNEEAFLATWKHYRSPYTKQLSESLTDDGKALILDQFVAEHTVEIGEYDPAALYLARCGLSYPVSSQLRYHPALDYPYEGLDLGKFPAMVAVMRAPRGQARKLYRTYLTPEGRLADVPHPRMVTDERTYPLKSCLELHQPRGGVIGIALSLESALAVYHDYAVPTVAAITYQNLANFTAPKEARHLIIFANNDLAALDSALVLSDRAKAAGLTVKIMRLPESSPSWCALRAKRLPYINGCEPDFFLQRPYPLPAALAALYSRSMCVLPLPF